MTKPEWGTKRICTSCNTRFYDMQRQPIVCPKCETVFDPEALNKKKRGRPPASEQKKQPTPQENAKDTDLEIDEDIAAIEVDDDLLEDTSDFGEDEEVVGIEKPTEDD